MRRSSLNSSVRILAVILLCTLLNLSSSHHAEKFPDSDLTDEELRTIFGDRNPVPEFSLFVPNVIPGSGPRRKRSLTDTTHFEFNALGRSYQFKIKPVEDLISPDFVLIGRDGDQTYFPKWTNHSLCAYQGRDVRNSLNSIALVMCGNVRGVVNVPEGELVIEPLPESLTRQRRSKRSASNLLGKHIVYRRRDRSVCPSTGKDSEKEDRGYLFSRFSSPTEQFSSLGHNRDSFISSFPKLSSNKPSNVDKIYDSRCKSTYIRPTGKSSDMYALLDSQEREASSPNTYYIETAVFVDSDLLRLMETNFPIDTEEQVIEFVLAMVNAVQLLYSDRSLGNKIKFVLKRLELLYHDPPDLNRPDDIDAFLTKFCLWQNTQNPPSDRDALHWDHALILTGIDLSTVMEDQTKNFQVVGLAPVAGMCTRTSSCTVNEGRHFESVYVVAHEIGHNLGMRHDGLQSWNNCDPSGYLMSPTLGSGKVTWSHCSKKYLNNFLSLRQSKCIRDKPQSPPARIDHEEPLLPGQRFSPDQQCMLKKGTGSRASFQQPQEEVCKDLHCLKEGYTWTSHPALEGTSCGPRKWCRRGDCVDMSPTGKGSTLQPSLPPTSSERENWGPWSECESSCLYGLDGILSAGSTGLSMSENQCISCRKDRRYKVCSAVQKCSARKKKTLLDYADEVCRNLRAKDPLLSGYGTRVPLEGLKSCEVECLRNDNSPVLTRVFFPDGTVCRSATNRPTYCVAGFCTEFRCDENSLHKGSDAVCRSSVHPPQDLYQGNPPSRDPPERSPSYPSLQGHTPFSDKIGTPHSLPRERWGPWVSETECRFSCLEPSKGIKLVSRSCLLHSGRCVGLDRNIQLCTPERKNCEKIESPFEIATSVCQRFRARVEQLSGIGMQLSSIPDDPDRGCTVACQDAYLKYRFYRVNGKEGWFPFGTECSNNGFTAFCVYGKCLEFNTDGTPLRDNEDAEEVRLLSARSLSLFNDRKKGGRGSNSFSHTTLKYIGEDVKESQWRVKRNVKTTAHRLPGSLQDSYLLSLIDEINATFSGPHVSGQYDPPSYVDLENPLFSDGESLHSGAGNPPSEPQILSPFQGANMTYKPGHFRWQMSPASCSVTCGEGLMEQTLLCVGDDGEKVNYHHCTTPPPPQLDRSSCHLPPCPKNLPQKKKHQTSQFGKWLLSLANDIQSEPS